MIYQLLLRLLNSGIDQVSSSELGDRLGITAHSVRKDISFLDTDSNSGAKYSISVLKDAIAEKLHFTSERKACIVGLGKIGSAILQYKSFEAQGFKICAGFDSNINRLETLNTEADLFPSYMIEEVVQERNIELAVLAVSVDAAELCFERLTKGGIKGIVNFTSALLPKSASIIVTDVDVTKELRILSAMTSLL